MSAIPASILYGLRFATAVCLALWLAFTFELENAYWAATSAALVCQPILGSTLRKGFFRAVGTLVGVVAVVAMAACFPQDRVGFTLCLASWCALCCFAGSRLGNFAAYGAALAGYTTAIIAGDAIAAPDQTFGVALARATEIQIGVACGTTVMSLTDFGASRRKLSATIRGLAQLAVSDLCAALSADGRPGRSTTAAIGQLAALDPAIDQALGEGAYWRFHTGPVRAALDGLFVCMAASDLLAGMRPDAMPASSDGLASLLAAREAPGRPLRPELAAACGTLAADLRAMPADGQPRRLLDQAADGLDGGSVALATAAWLERAEGPPPYSNASPAAPQDPLPALLNALWGFAAVAVCAVMWMATRWSDGPAAIEFATITVVLLSLRQDGSLAAATSFGLGSLLAVAVAAVTKFALLPHFQTFAGLSAVLFATIVPLAALSTVPRLAATLGPAAMNFVPILQPANVQSYDAAAFYNSAAGILVGCLIGALFLGLVVPLSPTFRARRILSAAERDRLAIDRGDWIPTEAGWTGRMRSRAVALPPAAGDAAYDQLIATFAQGIGSVRRFLPGARP